MTLTEELAAYAQRFDDLEQELASHQTFAPARIARGIAEAIRVLAKTLEKDGS